MKGSQETVEISSVSSVLLPLDADFDTNAFCQKSGISDKTLSHKVTYLYILSKKLRFHKTLLSEIPSLFHLRAYDSFFRLCLFKHCLEEKFRFFPS